MNVLMIASDDERDLLLQILFEKTDKHRVFFIPYDMNWCIREDFRCVADALITMSPVILLLNIHGPKLKDQKAKQIIDDIHTVFAMLKEGLREFGCRHPPFKIGSSQIPEDVIHVAHSITENFVKSTLSKPDTPC